MERKKVIKESLALAVFLPLAGYLVAYLAKKFRGESVYDILLTDKDFLKELADILEEEGGIDEFMKKYKPKLKPGEDYEGGVMWWYGGYNGVKWVTRVAGNNVHKVIDKLLDTKVVKDWAKKYKKSDLKPLGNALYFILTGSEFRNTYAEMLAVSAKKQAKEIEKQIEKGKIKESKSSVTISLKNLLPKNI
jgi:hypothetical protein